MQTPNPSPAEEEIAENQVPHTDQRRVFSSLKKWLERLEDLLERAEKRISENFRVPPNGG